MADTQEPTITATESPSAPTSDSPIIENTPTEPAVSPSVDAPIENPADAGEPAKTETPTPPTTESILGDETPKDGKSDDKKPEGDKAGAKPEEASKVELPTYEPFKLPENINLDKEPMDAFTKILGEIETGKLDHTGMQDAGQKLIDLAAKSTVDSINRLNDYYVQIHENQKKEWFELAKNDPDLAGGDEKAFREMAGRLNGSIGEYAGTDAQKSEFRALMKDTGVGNHPALLRMLNNMQKKIDSYTKETGDRSVPAQAPAPSKVKPYQAFYSGNNG